MPIEERCPECTNVITWVEPEQVTEQVMQDDPGLFYNLGIRGMSPAPVTRWVNVSKSRVCKKVYELDSPMTIPCGYRPGGKECGAFAVGRCSECGAAVCRYHGSYFDDRLLCEGCKTRIETVRAREKTRREAELRDRAESERRVAAERAAAKAAGQAATYNALPIMTNDDWVAFLRGTDPFDQVGDDWSLAWRGKRPGQLAMSDMVAIFRAGGFATQKFHVDGRWSFHHWVQDYAQGWVVAAGSYKSWDIAEPAVEYLVALLESGEVICVSKDIRRGSKVKVPSIIPAIKPEWKPDLESLALARPWLRGGWRA
jgi:hypothetical protein